LNLLAALIVLLGEETEVYSYLNPLIKLLVSVLLSIHLFYVLIQILVNLSGLHPHRFHIQEKVFFARLYYEAAFENSRITVFCGEANQADDLPNLLFGQRDPSSHVLIFSVLLGLTERFFYFCFTVSFASLLFFKK
jgi:hypothetical protein